MNIFKSTVIVSLMTFLSRILGLLREMVFATTFGATAGMDAFLVAFKIPNFLRRLFAEGAFSQAFVPVLSEYHSQYSASDMKALIQRVSGTLALIVLMVSIIGSLTSSIWIGIFAPGFHQAGSKFHLASQMLSITFPYLFFITLTALAGGILNVFHKFAVPAFTPVLLNVCLIVFALWGAPHFKYPEIAVAWGVLVAGIFQFIFQLPFLKNLGMLVWPKWGWNDPGVKRVLKLMMPALFGASVAQISLLLDTIFASFLKTGSVSWLYYSDRLMQFPLGVIGVALSTVALPHLSKYHAHQNEAAYQETLNNALRLVFVVALPSAVMLALFSGPILVTLFGYHAFSLFDIKMSQQSLIAFAVGLLFFIAVKVLVSAFYAKQNTRIPVRIGVIAMLVNMLLNLALIFPLKHAGLALATSLAAMINALLLLVVLKRKGWFQFQGQWWRFLVPVILSLLIISGLIQWLNPTTAQWYGLPVTARVLHLAIWLCGFVLAYSGLLWIMGVRKKHLFGLC